MEMRQLMPTLPILHRRFPLHLKRLLIQHQTISRHNSPYFIFFQLPTNQENLILRLNTSERFRHNLMISNRDGECALVVEVVHEHHFELFVVVVEAGLLRLEDEVGLEGEDVVEEAAEFVDFAFDFDDGAGVVLHEAAVAFHFLVEFLSFLGEIV